MPQRISVMTALVVLAISLQAEEKKRMVYPRTKVDKVIEKLHDVEITDAYRWLEDNDSPAVQKWTDEQNAFTRSYLDKLPGREKLIARLGDLMEIGRLSAAHPTKGRYFYTKREGKQNQAILYVREGVEGKDRVVIDPNQLAADGTVALDWWFASDDGRLVAYGTSKGGSEISTLRVREVDSGKDLPDVIERTRAAAVAWLPDAKSFYYTRYPQPGSVPADDEAYFRQVFHHRLGRDPAQDPMVFGAGRDKEDWPQVDVSPDGRWLLVEVSRGFDKNDVYLKDLSKNGPFVTIVENLDALFEVTLRNDVMYVKTNHETPRYRVMKVDPAKPARPNWQEVIPQGEDVLESFTAVGDKLVGLYMHKASSRLRIFDQSGKPLHEVQLPALGTISGLGAEWDGQELFYLFESFTIPPSVARLDLKTLTSSDWQRIPADIATTAFEVAQVEYRSKDGTPISMFLAHRQGLKLDGQNPVYLTGYGGFNVNLTPTFAAPLFAFLERGGVLALPNLRGGGEYGEAWHKAGMLDKKQNVFDDFLAAAEWLRAHGFTNAQRLAISGGSNGGLLMGAALTQRPDLFRVVICRVPLLDMVRYHKFRIARLWIPEYGDPDKANEFRWLHTYSPYHHVKDGATYPATLITSAELDTRVDPLHARKMAARLQTATGSDRPILLRLETKAGHGAGKPRAKIVEEQADIWSFVFAELGVK